MNQAQALPAAAFLDQQSLSMRDYHKAKRLAWDPQDFDWSRDQADWAQLTAEEQALIIHGISLFLGGEESVTHNLAPLLLALKHAGGTLEDELFVTSQMFDEARHVELFDAFSRHVVGQPLSAETYAGPSYTALFSTLDETLSHLLVDPSLTAQVDAVTAYHMIVEGVLAETGYYGIFKALRERGLLPALQQGLAFIQRDEARHVAFGLHLLSRAIGQDQAHWDRINTQMDALLPHALGTFIELIDPFLPDVPFDLDLNDILDYASTQFAARQNVLQRALRKPE